MPESCWRNFLTRTGLVQHSTDFCGRLTLQALQTGRPAATENVRSAQETCKCLCKWWPLSTQTVTDGIAYELLRRLFHIGNFCFWVPFFKQLLLKNCAVDFVKICNVFLNKLYINCMCIYCAYDSSFTWRHTGASSKTFNNNNNNKAPVYFTCSRSHYMKLNAAYDTMKILNYRLFGHKRLQSSRVPVRISNGGAPERTQIISWAAELSFGPLWPRHAAAACWFYEEIINCFICDLCRPFLSAFRWK